MYFFAQELKGDVWAFSDPVMCFCDGNLLGNHRDLVSWAQEEYKYEDFRPEALYSAIALEAYKDYFTQNKVCILINDSFIPVFKILLRMWYYY